MKKEDLIILLFALLLLAGMLYTIFFGGEETRHGVGSLPQLFPGRFTGIIERFFSSSCF